MTLQVKLPYYPKVQATLSVTRFGSEEISVPKIYEQPLPTVDYPVMRIDLLEILRDKLGDACFIYRDVLYNLLAGNGTDTELNNTLASFYRRYASIRKLANDAFFYGDETESLFNRIVLPLREAVDEYSKEVGAALSVKGYKYLVRTHDYMYYALRPNVSMPKFTGAKIIC